MHLEILQYIRWLQKKINTFFIKLKFIWKGKQYLKFRNVPSGMIFGRFFSLSLLISAIFNMLLYKKFRPLKLRCYKFSDYVLFSYLRAFKYLSNKF